MKNGSKRGFSVILTFFLLIGGGLAWAAKAPIAPENRVKEADTVLQGEVVQVTSQVKKSTVERAPGRHRDTEYSLRVKVTQVDKGAGVRVGETVVVTAWKPHTRLPRYPGLQGHESISEKGDSATFYLLKSGAGYEPLLPNVIDIK